MSGNWIGNFDGVELGSEIEIADGIYGVYAPFWGYPNVVYFIQSGKSWALVDTGIAETPEAFIAPFLKRHGGFDSLELVMCTHGHLDHIGGNSWVKENSPKAKFAIGARDAGWAEDVNRHYGQLYEYGAPGGWRPDPESETAVRAACGGPVAIDYPLHGGEILQFGEGRKIEASFLGAHTPGQTLYRDLDTNCIFTGDSIQNEGIFNSNSKQRGFPMYGNSRDYRKSLDVISSVPYSLICTAHAGMFEGKNAAKLLDDSIKWVDDFSVIIKKLATQLEDFSIEEIVVMVSKEYPVHENSLQIRVTTSEHLTDLVVSGFLSPHMSGTEKRWKIK